MIFKLVKSAEQPWRRLNGTNRLGQIIEGVKPPILTGQAGLHRQSSFDEEGTAAPSI